MKNNITKEQLSRFRQEVHRITNEVKNVAIKGGYSDSLLRGFPVEVRRRCGKSKCSCMTDPERRHGPYKVVQIYRDGKSKQLTLRKEEGEYFIMAQRYQLQLQNRARIVSLNEKLLNLFDQMIEARTIWDKKK